MWVLQANKTERVQGIEGGLEWSPGVACWDPGINSQLPHKSTRWEAHPVPKFMQGTWVSMEFGILGGVKNVAHRY